MAKKLSETALVTNEVRLSYAYLFEPHAFGENKPKYSVNLIIPKTDTETLKLLKEAKEAAIQAGKNRFGASWKPMKENDPTQCAIRDGDEVKDGDPVYEGAYFVNAKSDTPPTVVGLLRDPATGKAIRLTEEQVYSGCYARVSISLYPYGGQGANGIAVGLGNVQKTRDGDKLGSRSSAEEDFDFEDAPDAMDDCDFLL